MVKNIKQPEDKVQRYRILRIDEAIRSGGYPNASSMAKRFEVSPRTILRDIEYLKDMYNAPIEYDQSKKGFYYSEQTFFVKSVMLSEGEVFSVALFDQLLLQYRNTPIEQTLRDVFHKIIASLPEKVSVSSAFLDSKISFVQEPLAKIEPLVFEQIFSSMKQQYTVSFDYRPLSKTTWMRRIIDPYHVVCAKGNWYIIGFCHDKQAIRMFSFSRMKKFTISRQHFSLPENFSPSEFIDMEMGVWASDRQLYHIELQFDKEVSNFAIEYQWHRTQKVEKKEDGSIYVSFDTTQIHEVQRWVLGQGHTVKVLGPSILIQQISDELKKTSEQYISGKKI